MATSRGGALGELSSSEEADSHSPRDAPPRPLSQSKNFPARQTPALIVRSQGQRFSNSHNSHCQLANICKCCFLTGTFQDIKNYHTHRYWAAVPHGTSEFIVQCGRNNPYIPNKASQGGLSSSRVLRKQVPSGLSVNTIPYSLGVSRDKTALKSSTSLSSSKV